jgi:hypothetical protein
MSRYFFNISNGHTFHDPQGEDLPDDKAAWGEAVRTVRDIEDSLDPDRSSHWSLEVKRGDTTVFCIDVSARRMAAER